MSLAVTQSEFADLDIHGAVANVGKWRALHHSPVVRYGGRLQGLENGEATRIFGSDPRHMRVSSKIHQPPPTCLRSHVPQMTRTHTGPSG